MSAYEADLLARTRMQGLDLHGSRRLGDLELLARLQHHGAATRLLDFTLGVRRALVLDAGTARPITDSSSD